MRASLEGNDRVASVRELGTRKGLRELGPKKSHLSEVTRGPYASPGMPTMGAHLSHPLFSKDAGEGEEAQGHSESRD